MSDSKINGIIDSTMDKIRSLVDSQTIVGSPITVNEVTVIPVSRVSFGVASGGSDFASKNSQGTLFGGGGGAGASVTPVAFIVVKGNDVKMLKLCETLSPIERAVSAVPETVDRIAEAISSIKNRNKEQ